MSIVLTDDTYYQDIANAIRSKNGTTTQYKPSEMAAAINAISTGGLTTKTYKEIVAPNDSYQELKLSYHNASDYTTHTVSSAVMFKINDYTVKSGDEGVAYYTTTVGSTTGKYTYAFEKTLYLSCPDNSIVNDEYLKRHRYKNIYKVYFKADGTIFKHGTSFYIGEYMYLSYSKPLIHNHVYGDYYMIFDDETFLRIKIYRISATTDSMLKFEIFVERLATNSINNIGGYMYYPTVTLTAVYEDIYTTAETSGLTFTNWW